MAKRRLPIDEAVNFNWGEPEFMSDLQCLLQDFLELDKFSNNSLATSRWCPMNAVQSLSRNAGLALG